MKNKLLASILTACMLLTMLPTAAFAAETEAESGTEQTATATEQSDPVTEDAGDQTEGTADGTDAGDAASGQTAENFVAKVGDKYYATLAEAIDVADSKTVTLIANVTENVTIPAGTTVTLDLNGKTLTSAANDQSTIVVNGNLTVEDRTAGQPTVSNEYEVSYTSGSIKSTDIPVKVQNGGSFTLNGGKIESEKESGLFVIGDKTGTDAINSSATINGGYINSQEYGIGVVGKGASLTVDGGVIETRDNAVIGGNGTYEEGDRQGDTTITIKDGTLIGHITSQGYVACGIYHPQRGTLNISGGTIYADGGVGVLMRGGTANITGGKIITTGNQEVVGKVGDSKVVVGCHGIQVDGISRYYDYDNAKVEISGNVNIQSQSEAVKHTDTSAPAAQKIFISKGTFSSDVNDYCATGYTATKNESGQWVVSPKEGMEADTSVSGNTASAEVGGTFSGNEDLGQDNVGASNGTLSIDATVTEGDTAAITKTEVSIGNEALTSVSGANSVNSVVLKTNVADLTVDKAAWNAITANADGNSVTLTVEKKEDASSPADWTVSAVDSKGETVFSSEDQRDGEISISVPYTKENLNDGDQVVVYYIGENGQLEAMTTTYNQENKTLTWSTDHLSDFGDVIIGPDTEAVWISGTELKAGTLADALSAVASKGGTIDLVNNATLADAKFVISKNVTIQKSAVATNVPAISATVAAGETAGAFTVTENASLTLNGVKLVVQGTANTETDGGKYDGTGIILNNSANGTGGKFILNNAEVELTELQRGMVFQVTASNLASIEMNSSKLTIQNIDGNASNGGMWSIKNDSTVIVSHCGNHGLSVQEITVDHSMIHVDDAGYVGVLAQKVELKNGAEVSVTNSGNQLPLDSQWAPNGKKYENAVEIKKGGSLSVDETSSMELTGNKSNSILIADQGSLDNQGTITGEIVIAGSTQHLVKVLVDGKIVAAATVADKGSYTLPAAPSKSGYDFKGWSNGTATYAANAQVENITADMEFTAKWEKQKDDSSSGSSDNERTYAIITEDDGNGSVTVSADEASAGTRITVTVKPDAGYELDELTVTDAKNKDLKVTKRSETTYTFHMADSKVTVEASFTKDGTVQKPDTRFDDVAKSAWYYKAVEYVAENGIMSGVSAREFAPNAGFSRAMLAQTLYAMSGKPAVKAESIFADVAANAWYADAVNWAAEKGYVSGVGDGKFAPDASITREQMALILYRYAGSPDASGMVLREFADGDSVSAYAVDAIRWAVHEGLISGMENNTLAPQGTATRAQVAQILMNFHQKLDK